MTKKPPSKITNFFDDWKANLKGEPLLIDASSDEGAALIAAGLKRFFAEHGHQGGKSTSKAKQEAARRNGRKGGMRKGKP